MHYLTISEAAEHIRTGQTTATALTAACLKRIERLNDRLHAFITVTAADALAHAKLLDEELRQGNSRGPLHGIPIAHKDMICTRGIRTTAHSNLLRDWVPEEDAAVYTSLQQAGAVSLGKLSLWEFAFGSPGEAPAFPPARNPWNTIYGSGGSSSGSGAAVSAGLCFGATGTDTGGSIRHPAAVCGIVGMKPTFGRVSVRGVLPLAPSLDNVGPLTRTVRDNALMLQAMAGHDPGDASSATEPVPDFQRLIGTPIRGMRIGVPRRHIERSPLSPRCAVLLKEAFRVLCDLGAELVDFDLPMLERACEVGVQLLIAEAYPYHRANLERSPESYGRSFRDRVLKAASLSEQQLREARAVRAQLREEYENLFASGIEVIASPAREGIADTIEGLIANPSAWRGSCTRMYGMAGLPALAMPMGFGENEMPLGIQFAANQFQEPRIYQVAAAYEDATPWTALHPTI